MIRKDVQYSKCLIPCLVEFGKGDVAVMDGINEYHACVMFKNASPGEIGAADTYIKGQTSDEIGPELIMVFNKIESIDVVIGKLKLCKRSLIKLNKSKLQKP